MKKIMVIVAALMVSTVMAVFAQTAGNGGVEQSDSYADTSTKTINVEDKYAEFHVTASNVKLTMDYTPLTGVVHFYYECTATSFDQGEAMNTAMVVFQDFAAEHGFKHYTYYAKDKTRYFKDPSTKIRMAQYHSCVIFRK